MPATTRTLIRLPEPPLLYLTLELSNRSWKLAFSTGLGQKPRLRSIPARDFDALLREVSAARRRFHIDDTLPLISCYEARRDGFWIHHFLVSEPHRHNLVVDAASIDVKRRRRRNKTDRIDATKLLAMLIRYHNGEEGVWSVVHVPPPRGRGCPSPPPRAPHPQDPAHSPHQPHSRLARRPGPLRLLPGPGVPSAARRHDALERDPLPPLLLERLLREWEHRVLLSKRIDVLEQLQVERLQDPTGPAVSMVGQLMTLKGVGLQSAWLFTFEFFAWRNIRSRRELTALAGLSPSPYQSGDESRDQGISKAGSSSVRAMGIQIAWGWVRFQPGSSLTQWFERRFAHGGRRMRAIGIVALDRRLLIALWRFLETGALPEGATASS